MAKFYVDTVSIDSLSRVIKYLSDYADNAQKFPRNAQGQLMFQFGNNVDSLKDRLRDAKKELRTIRDDLECLANGLQNILDISFEIDKQVNYLLSDIPYTIIEDIPKNEVIEVRDINIKEWKPLEAITEAMVENIGDPSSSNVDAVFDAVGFINSFLGKLVSITNLRVTKGKDSKITIEYGTAIESYYSGKHTSLQQIFIDRYYNVNTLILFEADDRADEMIRSAFNLSGNGKYSMQLEFARVNVGDFGFKLIFENGELYQVPIIHEGTKMNVYYKENGESKLVFDAADILRNTKIKVPEAEAELILQQLRANGVV